MALGLRGEKAEEYNDIREHNRRHAIEPIFGQKKKPRECACARLIVSNERRGMRGSGVPPAVCGYSMPKLP